MSRGFTPRPCKRPASLGKPYCGAHAYRAALGRPVVTVSEGAFCVWCCGPGRTYSLGTIKLGLCKPHGLALAKAIREGR